MSTKPTGLQLEKLTNALLDAFEHDELTQLARHKLDLSLEHVTPVAGKRDLTTVVVALVAHFAGQENGLKDLLSAAQKTNPNNTELKELMLEWFDTDFAPVELEEFKETLASETDIVVGVNIEDVEVQAIKLKDISAQGDGDVTGVEIKKTKIQGELNISGVTVNGE